MEFAPLHGVVESAPLHRVVEFCSMVNRETLSEQRSELRSDALPATTIDFSGFEPTTHCAQMMYSNH